MCPHFKIALPYLLAVSDDEDEAVNNLNWAKRKVELNPASKALLIKWVRLGRTQIQKRGGPKVRKNKSANIEAVRKQRKKPKGAADGAGGKRGGAKRQGAGGGKKRRR
jgi:hypothetical protein